MALSISTRIIVFKGNSINGSYLINVLLCFAFLVLTGCASLSQDECLTADWNALGHEDGAFGRSLNYLSNHRKACAKHGITPDFNAYSLGHAKGVPLYCQPERAFTMASNGRSYPAICSQDRFPRYASLFRKGENVWAAKVAVKAVEEDILELQNEIDDALTQIQNNEDLIVSDTTVPKQRRELIDVNKQLELVVNGLQGDLYDLEQVLADKQYLLDNL